MRCSRGSVEGNGGGSDNAISRVSHIFSPDGITVMIIWCVMYTTDVENSCGDL